MIELSLAAQIVCKCGEIVSMDTKTIEGGTPALKATMLSCSCGLNFHFHVQETKRSLEQIGVVLVTKDN